VNTRTPSIDVDLPDFRNVDQAKRTPWADKTVRKVVWRGTLTGAFHRDRYDWRSSQRHRLSHLIGNTTSDADAVVLLERDDEGQGTVVKKENELDLIDRWMDVGLIKEVSVTVFRTEVGTCSRSWCLCRTYTTLSVKFCWTPCISRQADHFLVLQCGPGPTEEACRLDGGEQYAECPEYEASCDEMQAEYQWLDRMALEDSIP
jgi:beta-1,2-xylosyltransferase